MTLIEPSAKERAHPAYASDGVRKALLAGMAVIGLLVFGGGLWAATTSLAGAVLASGTVVVDSAVKKVQHATGGTVGQILVKDGDRVEQGALLVRLDETMVRANLQIVTKQLDEIAVREVRLGAERDGDTTLTLPLAIAARTDEPEMAALVEAEEKLFVSRREARLGQKAQLRQRIEQLRQEVDGLAAQQWAKGREIELVAKELDGAETLYARNLMSITKLTALQRDAARLAGERAQLQSAQAQSRGKIAEIELQVIQVEQDLRAEVMKELREATAKEAELVERRVAAEDQLRHIDIRAPQTGLVHELAVHTVGGVIGQGETLMVIVPEHDALVVEAKIAPQDIDHVRAGQPAFLRFTAFDQRTTPEFAAEVVRVAADLTREKETGLSYYVARIALRGATAGMFGRRAGAGKTAIGMAGTPPGADDTTAAMPASGSGAGGAAAAGPGGAETEAPVPLEAEQVTGQRDADRPEPGASGGFTLLPGMPAEVHIRTGERTALSYFFKPLSDQFARAFTER